MAHNSRSRLWSVDRLLLQQTLALLFAEGPFYCFHSSFKKLCRACRSLGPHILLLATHSTLLYLLSNSEHTSHCCSARCLSDGFSAYRSAASAACTCNQHQNVS